MIIGCVKEIKNNEFRVGLTPLSAKDYIEHGHTVLLETNAGFGDGFTDEDYTRVGVTIKNSAEEVWQSVDMIIKVKEPLSSEYKFFRPNLIIYTYLHLAADKNLTKALLDHQVTGVAYETIADESGLPCLRPMSEIAGRVSVLEAARFLYKFNGGEGILISPVVGAHAAKVVIIGAGIVGSAALANAYGLGANVTILDIDTRKLTLLQEKYPHIETLISNEDNVKTALKDADIIISGVLLPGASAPKMIKREYYAFMKKGAVIADVAIDQGGSTEVSRPTTHDKPIYEVDGIIHYMVANIPSAVPKTATLALNNATLKFGLEIADKGIEKALENPSIKLGLNTYKGEITHEGVRRAFNQ
jgi:alanine dehydrogenase